MRWIGVTRRSRDWVVLEIVRVFLSSINYLFNVAICAGALARNDPMSKLKTVHQAEILGYDWKETEKPRRWPQECEFPGSSCLRLRKPVINPVVLDDCYAPLDDLDARFICSGPFKFSF